MQNVKFKSIDEFLDFLPEDELTMTLYLRKLVFDCIPLVTEHLAFNVPFYRLHKNICFIWPASILWGKKKSYSGVRFGFTSGYLIPDEISYLDKGERKQVYWKDFKSREDIEEDMFKAYLFEAIKIDEIGTEKKIKRIR